MPEDHLEKKNLSVITPEVMPTSSQKSEVEVFMDGADKLVNSLMTPLMDKEKYDIDSKKLIESERIKMESKRIETAHLDIKSEHNLIKVGLMCAFLCGIGVSVLSFIFGKAELGIQVANTTISISVGGLFGYIAGGKKNIQKNN